MFVTLVNNKTNSTHLAICVRETDTHGDLFIFYPEFETIRYSGGVPKESAVHPDSLEEAVYYTVDNEKTQPDVEEEV